MNTTLPPSRDLPAARHAEIRAAVLTEITSPPARRWLAPLVTAAAALVVVGAVTWFAPWRSAAPSTVAGDQDVAAVEEECVRTAAPDGGVTEHHVIVGRADTVVLVVEDDGMVLCVSDAAGYAIPRPEPLTGPVSLDISMIHGEGDAPGHSTLFAGGRVSPDVAKVTLVWGEHSVDAQLGGGIYLARLSYPNWTGSENPPRPVVRAYDKNGTLLAEVAR